MTHEEMILKAREDLFKALPASVDSKGRAKINAAFELAAEAHRNQTRKTGLPYILHPLAVALVVVDEMRQSDVSIICAALLHDVVEDTPHTIEEIESLFGKDVAFLVNAVTKPNKKQVDNFQHILESVKGDIRVLLLKISDRLHNMRTLSGLRPQKQWKIASETQFFFAPLAGRLGLYKVKSELENLAFQFLNPQDYARIERLLAEDLERTKVATETFMGECGQIIAEIFGKAVRWDIRYRKPYSIWREMQERGRDFYHVPFKHYIRAVYSMEDICRESAGCKWCRNDEQVALNIYSALVAHYREQTGKFVNYMAQPKANGYRSIHFRLLNPYGSIEEFHVSSESMREQSYFGCVVESKEQWMGRLTAVLDDLAKNPELLMPGIRDSLFNEDIVVFTPKTQAVTLPKGATALDFAFEVHTDIGYHAKCARINGRLAGIRTELFRGDSVEIITDNDVTPQRDWQNAVVSYKAKKAINTFFKNAPEPQYVLCSHCHPLPESEDLIGFEDGSGKITVHQRHCPDAIRGASERGNNIVAVDFKAEADKLYPVRLQISGIDRYHLLRDILDCIVEDFKLSLSGLSTKTQDNIVSCTIDFAVHSAPERDALVGKISRIRNVEEINVQQ